MEKKTLSEKDKAITEEFKNNIIPALKKIGADNIVMSIRFKDEEETISIAYVPGINDHREASREELMHMGAAMADKLKTEPSHPLAMFVCGVIITAVAENSMLAQTAVEHGMQMREDMSTLN